jgi:hypothetical protein
VPEGYTLRVETSGYIRFTPGGTDLVSFPEGTYDGTATTHDVRLQDRLDWIDYTRQHGTWLAINTDVPLGLVVAVKGDGGSVPTTEWTRALMPYDPINGRDRVFNAEELWQAAGGKPGPYRVYVGLNDINQNNAADSMVLTLTYELDGLGGTHEGDPWHFRWAKAIDSEDRIGGAFCAETGFWAPESRLVHVNGRRVIDDWAEEDES